MAVAVLLVDAKYPSGILAFLLKSGKVSHGTTLL
jgi:hypothetical protein